ncbi:hypothetical protein J0B03_05695 [Alkalibacter rhizosphaerae]|uniref:Uncharacterized protein n=1 Tax=Alkalibacter rhizosphaerae TaxID=2815577 RepID=A0A974XIT9_9FIRM|nr:hypothetical protein [Alkalibacter rhizosphaerae]QSX09555.1 hypothetical protein J0B03_05695 [Alkalibacter rhizosphaerae]
MTKKKEMSYEDIEAKRFINGNVSECPMCGSAEPRWAIDSEGDAIIRVSFKCESCGSVLSALESYIYKWNREMFQTLGCSKLFIQNKRKKFKLKVEKLWDVNLTCVDMAEDFSLKDIKKFANSLTGCIEEAPKSQ